MENKPIIHFNIRVYGLIINAHNQVLVSDEYMLDRYMTKFPGGGLRFGEGPEDCIIREAMEEFSQEIEIIEHFYTTGFFQKAEFFEDHQLISIYYRIRFKEPPAFRISDIPYDFPAQINGSQSFRWLPVNTLNEKEFTFPIDRKVAEMLKTKFSQGLL